MRGNRKVACGSLAVILISGILGLGYLITLGVKGSECFGLDSGSFFASVPVLTGLAAIMAVSSLIMILALRKKK